MGIATGHTTCVSRFHAAYLEIIFRSEKHLTICTRVLPDTFVGLRAMCPVFLPGFAQNWRLPNIFYCRKSPI